MVHPWIVENQERLSESESDEIAKIFLRLKTCKQLTRFQMALLQIFLINLDEERVAENLNAFRKIDVDNSG